MKRYLASVLALALAAPALGQAPATTAHQGFLTQNGAPVNGPVNLAFRLFTTASGGTPLWTETQNGVSVSDGVYGATLGSVTPLSSVDFNQPLWLEEQVGATVLTPRTRLAGVPYALGMRLPATLSGSAGSAALLSVQNNGSNGTGVYSFVPATSGNTLGVHALSAATGGYGVLGHASATSGPTIGVVGRSDSPNGSGVWGHASATSGTTNGVWGVSAAPTGRGVLGEATATSGGNFGLLGRSASTTGFGAYAEATATSGANYGIYGRSFSTAGHGVFGWASAGSGTTYGVFGYANSPSGYGVYGTNVGGGYAARFDGDVGIYAGSGGSPKIILDPNFNGDGRVITQELQINGGSDLAEHFDVAPFPGVGAPLPGMVVAIDPEYAGRLTVADAPYDPLVAGVVSGAGGVETGFLMGQEGSIADGDTPVALVGRVYVLVDAAYGAVRPGDLLTTSATAGHAMRAADRDRAPGAVLGKAMTGLETGRGLVLVLVGLQ